MRGSHETVLARILAQVPRVPGGGVPMKRFIEGEDRSQSTLCPEHLDDYIAEDNPVRVIDVFVDELNLMELGFEGTQPEVTGRPAYHPGTLLKIYIYGYSNRIQS